MNKKDKKIFMWVLGIGYAVLIIVILIQIGAKPENKPSLKLEDVNFGYHSLSDKPEQNFWTSDMVQIVFKDGCRGIMNIYSGWDWITYEHPVRLTFQGINYPSKKEIEIGEEIYKECDDVLALPKEEIIQKVKDILNVEEPIEMYEGYYIYSLEFKDVLNKKKIEAALDYLNGNCLKAKELLEDKQ